MHFWSKWPKMTIFDHKISIFDHFQLNYRVEAYFRAKLIYELFFMIYAMGIVAKSALEVFQSTENYIYGVCIIFVFGIKSLGMTSNRFTPRRLHADSAEIVADSVYNLLFYCACADSAGGIVFMA